MEALFVTPQIAQAPQTPQSQNQPSKSSNNSSFGKTLSSSIQNNTTPESSNEMAEATSSQNNDMNPASEIAGNKTTSKESSYSDTDSSPHKENLSQNITNSEELITSVEKSITEEVLAFPWFAENDQVPPSHLLGSEAKEISVATAKNPTIQTSSVPQEKSNLPFLAQASTQSQIAVSQHTQQKIMNEQNPTSSLFKTVIKNDLPGVNVGELTKTVSHESLNSSNANNGKYTLNFQFSNNQQNVPFSNNPLQTQDKTISLTKLNEYSLDSVTIANGKNSSPHAMHQLHVHVNGNNSEHSSIQTPKVSSESVIASVADVTTKLETSQLDPQRSLRTETTDLRQNISAQFMNAKLASSNSGASQSENDQMLNNQNKQQSSLENLVTLQPKTVDTNHETTTPSLFSQTLGDKSPILGETARPLNFFQSHQVFENEILNQVSQKLRINAFQNNPKIAIKLHPAELGELKVDIQFRDNGVNASIVVQNQKVLEVLERNMPKLKAMMEQQGLKVSELLVSVENEVGSEENVFEEHLSQEENGFSKRNKSNNSNFFSLSQEEDEEEIDQIIDNSNVNVKV